jgi:predicted metalloprotease with PDZ domain
LRARAFGAHFNGAFDHVKNFAALILSTGLALMHGPLASAAPKIHYELGMSQPHTHLFEVKIIFTDLDKSDAQHDLILPVWRSGRYVVFDFAGGVQEFEAFSSEREQSDARLAWSKLDKSTWRVQTAGSRVVSVSYKVYANEFHLRTRGLNDQHGFANGSALFMYVEKYRRLPLTLQVVPYGDWHVSTGLDRVKEQPHRFHAPDYDYFIDCPLEIGKQKDFAFEVQGKKHYLSIYGTGNWESEKLLERLRKVVQTCYEFWGELPYEHYTFLVHSRPSGGGGTEHINSTIMGVNSFAFGKDAGYEGFTSLALHEFFHTWNVKQLRPAGIHPYDYTRENYSPSLWISEGATNYYTMMLMRRAKYHTPARMLTRLAEMIRNDRRRPGRKVQSLEESSFDAWIKFWKDSQDEQNREVSYYEKGSSVSLLLDLEIRRRTENRASLDDVMRAMYKRFPLSGPGFTPEDFENVVAEIGGGSYREFFDDYVRGTAELDFAKHLGYAGLRVKETMPTTGVALGVNTREQNGAAYVQSLMAGSPAYEAGVNTGDEIVALNGVRVRASQLEARLADYKPGDKVKLTLFRDEQLRELEVTLQPPQAPEVSVQLVEQPTDLQKKIYASWMAAPWPEAQE